MNGIDTSRDSANTMSESKPSFSDGTSSLHSLLGGLVTMPPPINGSVSSTEKRILRLSDIPMSQHKIGDLVGNGTFGYVWRTAQDRVRKKPKIYDEDDEDIAYGNMTRRADLMNERAVYERLGDHDGIIQCFATSDDFIELALANQGDLSSYLRFHSMPSQTNRATWMRSLVDTFSYIHSRRVVVQDIALRNILVHDKVLKLCDFGQASLLPMDTNMEQFCANDTTPQIEILHLGCVLYSIAVWQELKYDYFKFERWPQRDELPDVEHVLLSSVIQKCFRGEYFSMEALRCDIQHVACH